MRQVAKARQTHMGFGIGLPFAPQHGKRMINEIRQKLRQGEARGDERGRWADREASQAIGA